MTQVRGLGRFLITDEQAKSEALRERAREKCVRHGLRVEEYTAKDGTKRKVVVA